jgi:predicted nucleic acid-binding protein
MSTTNEIFVDSCILIEYVKGNQVDFLDKLLSNPNNKLYFNSIVVSEFLFHYLAFKGQKSPMSIKQSGKIKEILELDRTYLSFLKIFTSVSMQDSYINDAVVLMTKHNLLPNDALILSTVMYYRFDHLATFDKDLIVAGSREQLSILSQNQELNILK